MDFKDLIKTTEGLVVLGGLFLTVVFGKFYAYATAIAYILLNLPKAWDAVKNYVIKLTKWF